MKGFSINASHSISDYLISNGYEMIYYSSLNGYFKKKVINRTEELTIYNPI